MGLHSILAQPIISPGIAQTTEDLSLEPKP